MVNVSKSIFNLFQDLLRQGFIPEGSDTNPDFSSLKNKLGMVIANLMPVKLIRVESRWMILTAVDKGGIYLVVSDKESKLSIIIR